MAHIVLTLCAIGSTGVGKSSLCNLIIGIPGAFEVCSGLDTCTRQPVTQMHQWLGNGPPVRIIDTPGLNDPEGRDTQNIAAMAEHLKSTSNVNAFLLVINSQAPHLDESARANLKILSDIFLDFFSHVVLVFTRWEYGEKAEKKRIATGVTKQQKVDDINALLKKDFLITTPLQAVFVDNMADMTDTQEGTMVSKELQKLWDLVKDMPEFSCAGIEARPSQIDAMKAEVDEMKENADSAEAKAEEVKNELDEVMQQRLKEQEELEEELRRKEKELEEERMEKDAERRRHAKEIYEDNQRKGIPKEWTFVTCPAFKVQVPTTLPHLIMCGPGNKVTVLRGGHIAGCGVDYGMTVTFKETHSDLDDDIHGKAAYSVMGGIYCHDLTHYANIRPEQEEQLEYWASFF